MIRLNRGHSPLAESVNISFVLRRVPSLSYMYEFGEPVEEVLVPPHIA